MMHKEPYNLAAYFLLPLLKLNTNSFGANNFLNAYVLLPNQVVVTINDKQEAKSYFEHESYITDYDEEDCTVIIYDIPEVYKSDYKLIVEGKYSEVNDLTKDIIAKNSGLAYRKPTGKKYTERDQNGRLLVKEYTTTHRFLKALFLEDKLKLDMEEQLGVNLDGKELLSKMSEDEFYKV